MQHMILILSHFDIQLAILIGELEEEIYMVQPLGLLILSILSTCVDF